MRARRQNTTFLAARGFGGGAAIAAATAIAAIATDPAGYYIGAYVLGMLIAAFAGAIVGGLAALLTWILVYAVPAGALSTWLLAVFFGLGAGTVANLLTARILDGNAVVIGAIALGTGLCTLTFSIDTIIRSRRRRTLGCDD